MTAGLGPDGEQIEVHVRGTARVVVEGYQGEPYLRIDRRGSFENTKSPAVASNRTRIPGSAPRGGGDTVRWVRLSADPQVRWHDHRAHWMGGSTPLRVERAPGRSHVIRQWRIPVTIDGRSAAITGRLIWDPPPTAWHWLGLAAALFALVICGSGIAARPVLLAATTTIAIAEALHVWGAWPFSTASALGRVLENLPSLTAIGVNAFMAWRLTSRTVWRVAPLLVVAGLFGVVAGGLSDLSVLSHSWIPSRLDPRVARTLVATNLGLGAAIAFVGLRRLRAPSSPTSDPATGLEPRS